jgi:hypothetical protein
MRIRRGRWAHGHRPRHDRGSRSHYVVKGQSIRLYLHVDFSRDSIVRRSSPIEGLSKVTSLRHMSCWARQVVTDYSQTLSWHVYDLSPELEASSSSLFYLRKGMLHFVKTCWWSWVSMRHANNKPVTVRLIVGIQHEARHSYCHVNIYVLYLFIIPIRSIAPSWSIQKYPTRGQVLQFNEY